jgi:hypothetical protein
MFTPFLAVQTSLWPLAVSFIIFSTLSNVVLYIQVKISLALLLSSAFFLVLTAFM